MTRGNRSLTVAALLGVAAFAQAPKPAATYKDIKYPQAGAIHVPEPIRFQLPNGMKIMLREDHELPTINVSVLINAGGRWVPSAKLGLAAITGTVMRTGGSTTRNGDQLDRELDRLAASVETGSGSDSASAGIFCLKEDIDKTLPILADILQHPAFPQDKIDLAKIELRDSIARRNDEPQDIAFREFDRVIYGKDSPYGRLMEYATLNSITRSDVQAWYKRFYRPEAAILGAYGDFNATAMRAKIEQAFAAWPRGQGEWNVAPPIDPAAKSRGGIYLIDKDDLNQSTVIMGRLSGRLDDPDHIPLTVMNGILGLGLGSRLFSQVRSEQALAYAVWSNWSGEYEFPGTFQAFGGTKSETTVKIIGAIRREIDRMAQGPVTDDELTRAKDSILKGMAFDFDSTGKIVDRLMQYEYYRYPPDFLQRYQEGIRKVTRADVERVAKSYLQTAQFAILVLGKEKAFEAPLSTLGKVTRIDITIPKEK